MRKKTVQIILFIVTFCILLIIVSCIKKTVVPTATNLYIETNSSITLTEALTINKDQYGFEVLSGFIDDYTIFPLSTHNMLHDVTITTTMSDSDVNIYFLDLDLVNHTIYMSNGLDVRVIEFNRSIEFFSHEIFQYIFEIPFTTPTITITYNETPVDYQYLSNLYYPSYNDSTINQINNLPEQESNIPIVIKTLASSDILTDFDINPDTITQSTTPIDSNETTTSILNSSSIIPPKTEGYFKVQLTCEWLETNDAQFFGIIDYFLYIDIDYAPEVTLISTDITPGEIGIIEANYLNDNQKIAVSSDFGEEVIYPVNTQSYAIISIPCYSSPGNYEIAIQLLEEDIIIDEYSIEFSLMEKEFLIDLLYVTASTAAINTNNNAAQDQVYFDMARANPIQEPLIEGPFIQPTEGRISTEYGVIRVTNDDYTNTRRHYGIDFANTLGTPVNASNSGVVTLSRELIITGNTIIIDHGMGLFSMYYHLDELLIEEGINVNKGTHISNMGSSGYSTGSHLHFGIWYDGVYLNPWSFFEEDYFSNYIQ